MTASLSFPHLRLALALCALFVSALTLRSFPTPASASGEPHATADATTVQDDTTRLADALASLPDFAARARPRLLAAGYGSPAEAYPAARENRDDASSFGNERYDDPEDWITDTARLAERLWYFSPFPGVAEALLSGLEQPDLPVEARLDRFLGQSDVLYKFLERAELGECRDWREWSEFWLADRAPESVREKEAATMAARRKAAMAVVPLALRLMEEEAPPAHLAAMHARGMPAMVPWKADAPSPAVSVQATDYEEGVQAVLDMLAANPDDEALWARTADFLASGPGTPEQRLRAVPTLVWNTDPVSAVMGAVLVETDRNSNYADWLTCWDWSTGRNSFAYSLQCSVEGNGAALLARWLPDQERICCGLSSEPAPPGEAARLDRLDTVPDMATLLASETPGRPYLLFAKERAVPEAAQGREFIHVFADTPFSMGGPLLLPLSADKAEDAELLEWYIREGADAETSLLLISPAPRQRLARRVQAWHLQAQAADNGPPVSVALGIPYTASFWFAHLSNLRGRAVSLLLEPGESLYLKHPSVLGDAWFVARPGPAAHPFPDGRGGLLLELSAETEEALNARFVDDFLDRTARQAMHEWPRPGVTPRQALAFMAASDGELTPLGDAEEWSLSDYRKNLLLLWRLEDSPARGEGRRILLAPARDGKERRARVEQLLKNAELVPSAAHSPSL